MRYSATTGIAIEARAGEVDEFPMLSSEVGSVGWAPGIVDYPHAAGGDCRLKVTIVLYTY